MNKEKFEKSGKTANAGKNCNAKGQRNNRKGKFRSSKPEAERAERGKAFTNDASWYTANANLVAAAANVPFPYRPGMVVPIDANGSTYRVPGVLHIDWAPWVGAWNNPTSPVSLAAQDIFNRVRAVYSGSLEADSPDFMMYFLALDSIYSYIGYLKRLYKTTIAYSSQNYVTPNGLLKAMAPFDEAAITAMRTNRDQFWQNINTLIGMTTRFRCPAVFPLFNRHYWLNENVYTDDTSLNSQFYVFQQTHYLKFGMVEHLGHTAGGCTYVPLPESCYKGANVVQGMYDFGAELISALSGTDDTFIISGYLTRTFDGAPNFSVPELAYNEIITPAYDEVVLSQIQNAYTPFTDGKCKINLKAIYQDPTTNIINTDFELTVPEAHQGTSIRPFLNLRKEQPNPVDVIEASRLQTTVLFDMAEGAGIVAGTELVTKIWMDLPDGSGHMPVIQHMVYDTDPTLAKVDVFMSLLAAISAFDWHPFIFVNSKSTSMQQGLRICGDIANFTTMDFHQMAAINR